VFLPGVTSYARLVFTLCDRDDVSQTLLLLVTQLLLLLHSCYTVLDANFAALKQYCAVLCSDCASVKPFVVRCSS
jgi:hypothetical protein